MKYKDLGDYELHCIQKWVISISEHIELNVLKDSEKKFLGKEVEFKYNSCETPIFATTLEEQKIL